MLRKITAGILLIAFSPLLLILYILVKASSKGPFIFKQMRLGKNRKPFFIFKIRTMVWDAEILKQKYIHLNQANGPVFKIRNDPRYTFIGRTLSHYGLDEILQLINIIRGEMAFVGPRPFPVNEAEKISNKYKRRFNVLPGVISLWIIEGSHKLAFEKWMENDISYIRRKSYLYDFFVFIKLLYSFFLILLHKKKH
jgi:lipopolysaccharide/colanic/teichoic acid biosynthesis glycosyltransferase